jgi:hypothetical protein
MKPEQGKWYTNDWKGPTILIEYWNGSVERTTLRDARLDLCGKEYGIKRWCLLPEDTANAGAHRPEGAKTGE